MENDCAIIATCYCAVGPLVADGHGIDSLKCTARLGKLEQYCGSQLALECPIIDPVELPVSNMKACPYLSPVSPLL